MDRQMKLGSPAAMSKEPGGPADAPGHVGLSVEELEDELDEALKALSSGLCSAHRKPDPLHCDTCNKVAWLTSTNLERMKQIDSLREQLGESQKALGAALTLATELVLELKFKCKDPLHEQQLAEISRQRTALSK